MRTQKTAGLTLQKNKATAVVQKSQKPPNQKRMVDNLQEKKKFAIVSSLNTSAPVKYIHREPKETPAMKTEISLQHLPCKQVRRGRDESTGNQKRPESQATTVSYSKASETSYQQYIISQATATPDDQNTPTEMALSRDRSSLQNLSSLHSGSSARHSQQGSVLADSSQSSFQSGLSDDDSHQSVSVASGDQQHLEAQFGGSSLLSKYESQRENIDTVDESRHAHVLQGSYDYYDKPSDSAATSTQLSRMQSGALKLEVDMRFDAAETTRPAHAAHLVQSSSQRQLPLGGREPQRREGSKTSEAELQSSANVAGSQSRASVMESQSHSLQIGSQQLDSLEDLGGFPPEPPSMLEADVRDLGLVASQHGSGFVSGSDVQLPAEDTLSAKLSLSSQQDFKSDESSSQRLLESGMEPAHSQSSLSSRFHSRDSETVSTKSLIQSRSDTQIISLPLQSLSPSNSSQKSRDSSETTTHCSSISSSSTLKQESFLEKFSTPFAGSFSSLGEPSWFHSQSITSRSDQSPATTSPSAASITTSKSPDGAFSSQLLKDQREDLCSSSEPPLGLQVPPSGSYTFASIPIALDTFTSNPEKNLEFRVQEEGKFSNVSLSFEQNGQLLDVQFTGLGHELKAAERNEAQFTEVETDSGSCSIPESTDFQRSVELLPTSPGGVATSLFPEGETLEIEGEEKASVLPPDSPRPEVSGHHEVESTMKQLLAEKTDIPQENLVVSVP